MSDNMIEHIFDKHLKCDEIWYCTKRPSKDGLTFISEESHKFHYEKR